LVVPATQVLPSQQPAQGGGGGGGGGAAQVWPVQTFPLKVQLTQAELPVPQAVSMVPAMQVPLASQQPLGQLQGGVPGHVTE
jgi:hypothetical protein